MTAKTEAAVIRSQLRLRKDYLTGECEVFTTALGANNPFKWYKCSQSMFSWYAGNFSEIPIERLNVPHEESGALKNSTIEEK